MVFFLLNLTQLSCIQFDASLGIQEKFAPQWESKQLSLVLSCCFLLFITNFLQFTFISLPDVLLPNTFRALGNSCNCVRLHDAQRAHTNHNSGNIALVDLRFYTNRTFCFAFQLEKYSTTILSAMMAGMDDKDDLEDEITLESMSGLAKILAKLDENNVRQILINICLRIRPCFEKVSATKHKRSYVKVLTCRNSGKTAIFTSYFRIK